MRQAESCIGLPPPGNRQAGLAKQLVPSHLVGNAEADDALACSFFQDVLINVTLEKA